MPISQGLLSCFYAASTNLRVWISHLKSCEDCLGDLGLLVEELVGPVPEKWPTGGWRELVEDKVAQKLPVDSYVYEKLMQDSPSTWKNLIVEASGQLALHIPVVWIW